MTREYSDRRMRKSLCLLFYLARFRYLIDWLKMRIAFRYISGSLIYHMQVTSLRRYFKLWLHAKQRRWESANEMTQWLLRICCSLSCFRSLATSFSSIEILLSSVEYRNTSSKAIQICIFRVIYSSSEIATGLISKNNHKQEYQKRSYEILARIRISQFRDGIHLRKWRCSSFEAGINNPFYNSNKSWLNWHRHAHVV